VGSGISLIDALLAVGSAEIELYRTHVDYKLKFSASQQNQKEFLTI
jgi:hypothetical protein